MLNLGHLWDMQKSMGAAKQNGEIWNINLTVMDFITLFSQYFYIMFAN